MPGSLNDVLPEPVSQANLDFIEELLRRKMRLCAGIAVRVLHAMEERFGPGAREAVLDMGQEQERAPRKDAGEPEDDLKAICDRLDHNCAGSHGWERLEDQPDRKAYKYTKCLIADVFRELGEPDLGFIICAGDGPSTRAYNPGLGFKRTKTLMRGDDCCDHVWYVRKDKP